MPSTFTVPNQPSAWDSEQAEVDSGDFSILAAGISGDGVLVGCAVSPQGTPNMTVAVAAGLVKIGGAVVSVAAGNVTIGAASASARFDGVFVNNAGTKSVVAGTASANPQFPAKSGWPANSICLAMVFVPVTATTITSNNIVDKRTFVSAVPPTMLDKGAVGNNTTDDQAAIQGAIDAAATVGGGVVVVPSGANCAVGSTITLKSKVVLVIQPGASLKWTGSVGGTMFASPTADPLQRAGVIGGGYIDPNTNVGLMFDLHSPQFCTFENLEIGACTTTSTLFKIRADATNASGYESSRQACFSQFRQIYSYQCGTFLDLGGQAGGSPGVVTLNEFADLECRAAMVFGIRCVEWVDNNHFGGFIRMALGANNAVGIVFNDSATPAANVGVYANSFDNVAIDAFGSLTGRVGVKLNYTYQTVISFLHCQPTPEGGILVDNNSLSHQITYTDSPSTLARAHKGTSTTGMVVSDNIIFGPAASTSTPVFLCSVAGDTQYRFRINGDGTYSWGSGSAVVDTTLYRTAVGQLTSQQLILLDGLTTKTVAGAVTDGAFTTTPIDGTMAIDTTNSKIFVRVGGLWKSVTVA